MMRWKKWVAPMAALVLMAGFHATATRADDDATPTGKATVTVTVVDADGKPVEGASISLLAPAPKHSKGTATSQPDETPKAGRATPLQTGTTGADGTFALTKVPDGSFTVMARVKGKGNGRAKVTVADGKDETVSVTLKARKAKAAAN